MTELIRIAPSRLESYRLYRTEDWFTTERLYEQLTEPFRETPEMALGSAFHALIEGEQVREPMFAAGCLDKIQPLLERGPCFEVSGERVMETDYGPALVSTRCDAAVGNELHEFKTTGKSLQPDKYADSAQWKAMLWALEGFRSVEYWMFQLRDTGGAYRVTAFDRVKVYWSDVLVNEIRDLVHGLVEFYRLQGIEIPRTWR